jgi:UDP-glucuronate 4-epimerase
LIEENVGKKALINFLPLQSGDVPDTCADINDLQRDLGYRPETPVEAGVAKFVAWYMRYYNV